MVAQFNLLYGLVMAVAAVVLIYQIWNRCYRGEKRLAFFKAFREFVPLARIELEIFQEISRDKKSARWLYLLPFLWMWLSIFIMPFRINLKDFPNYPKAPYIVMNFVLGLSIYLVGLIPYYRERCAFRRVQDFLMLSLVVILKSLIFPFKFVRLAYFYKHFAGPLDDFYKAYNPRPPTQQALQSLQEFLRIFLKKNIELKEAVIRKLLGISESSKRPNCGRFKGFFKTFLMVLKERIYRKRYSYNREGIVGLTGFIGMIGGLIICSLRYSDEDLYSSLKTAFWIFIQIFFLYPLIVVLISAYIAHLYYDIHKIRWLQKIISFFSFVRTSVVWFLYLLIRRRDSRFSLREAQILQPDYRSPKDIAEMAYSQIPDGQGPHFKAGTAAQVSLSALEAFSQEATGQGLAHWFRNRGQPGKLGKQLRQKQKDVINIENRLKIRRGLSLRLLASQAMVLIFISQIIFSGWFGYAVGKFYERIGRDGMAVSHYESLAVPADNPQGSQEDMFNFLGDYAIRHAIKIQEEAIFPDFSGDRLYEDWAKRYFSQNIVLWRKHNNERQLKEFVQERLKRAVSAKNESGSAVTLRLFENLKLKDILIETILFPEEGVFNGLDMYRARQSMAYALAREGDREFLRQALLRIEKNEREDFSKFLVNILYGSLQKFPKENHAKIIQLAETEGLVTRYDSPPYKEIFDKTRNPKQVILLILK